MPRLLSLELLSPLTAGGSRPSHTLLATAFEAGAFVDREFPTDLEFRWVNDSECAQERRLNLRPSLRKTE